MAEPGKANPGEGLDKQKMKQILVPALAVAAIVLLVGLVVYVSDAAAPKKMPFDGSNGSADDPDLKTATEGVQYRDLKEGSGTPCPPGGSVKVHYVGWLANGDEFDRSPRPKPVSFELSGVVAGWREGIPGMKPGGIRKLVIAPEKGYGKNAKSGIPANSTLIFEVELVDSTPPPRPRRYPAPADLTKLSDGTAPGADDPGLKPIGTAGLMYRDLKEGDGPACPEGASVIMDYTGWLKAGGPPFDSSWKGKGPLDSSLGGLIQGWQQGVPGMKLGGIRKLVIPPALGYGAEGQGSIPGNATLVFEIELLGIKSP